MTDGTSAHSPHPHLDIETLSAYFDSELPPDDEGRTALHLASCGECSEQLSELRAARAAMARPVEPLSGPVRSALVANAIAAAAADIRAPDDAASRPGPIARARRPGRAGSTWLTRAAVIVAGAAVVGGAVLGVRAVSNRSSSVSASGPDAGATGSSGSTSTSAPAGVPSTPTTLPNRGSTGSTGPAWAGAGAAIAAGDQNNAPSPPRRETVLVFRPVLEVGRRACPPPSPAAPNAQLSVPVPQGQVGPSNPVCLHIGHVIVFAPVPTRVSVGRAPSGGYFVTIALTPDAADVLRRHGVAQVSELARATTGNRNLDSWSVVAIQGRFLLGDVSNVVHNPDLTPTPYEAVVAGLTETAAIQVRNALRG